MRTASMPGCQLRVGDVIWEAGLRWRIQKVPQLETLDSGRSRWYVPVQLLDTLELPANFYATAIVHGVDVEWIVEFNRS